MSARPTLGRALAAALLALSATPRPGAAQGLTLAEAIESALASHPVMAAAVARADGAGEAAVAARAARLPGAAVEATLTRFQEPMIVAPLHEFDPRRPPSFDPTLVQGRLGVQYTLFDGGARGARIRAAEAGADAARLGATEAEMEVLEQVVGAYLGVLTARAVRAAAVAQTAALEAERRRVEQNLAAGTAAEVEVLRADASLQEARARQASAEARSALAERALERASGLPAERVRGRSLAPVSLAEEAPTGASSVSPLVEQATRRVRVAAATVEEQRGGRLPRLEASAGVLDFGTLDGGHTAEWQAGVQLSWPLFTGGARSARIRGARAELAAARAERDATELRLAQEVDAAETAAREASARIDALASAERQWAEVARIERLALSAGSGVQSDLLRAEAGLFGARAGLAQARRDAILAQVRLARARGALDTTWLARALEEAQ